jgi:hypothetical protein
MRPLFFKHSFTFANLEGQKHQTSGDLQKAINTIREGLRMNQGAKELL